MISRNVQNSEFRGDACTRARKKEKAHILCVPKNFVIEIRYLRSEERLSDRVVPVVPVSTLVLAVPLTWACAIAWMRRTPIVRTIGMPTW